MADGATMMENALEKAPWHREWRQNLIRAFETLGQADKARSLRKAAEAASFEPGDLKNPEDTYENQFGTLSVPRFYFSLSDPKTEVEIP